MKYSVFECAVTLQAPIAKVYAFHENPHNLLSISPSWLDARVDLASVRAKQGEEFSLQIGLPGIPLKLRWLGFWEEAVEPGLLVDGMKKGLFLYWQHQHRFETLDAGTTRMTDHVTYLFPGGWLGRLFGETLGRLQFRLMFADRHRRTRQWMLAHGSDPAPAPSA